MEKLIVESFLTIEKAQLEIGKMTVVIGPQASGKSVLAKLVLFFRDFWHTEFLKAVKNPKPDYRLSRQLEKSFETYFPAYGWKNKPFSLKYSMGGVSVTVTHTLPTSATILKTRFSANIVKVYREARKIFEINFDTAEWNEADFAINDRAFEYILFHWRQLGLRSNTTFIPASRSFFATIQSRIFSLLDKGFEVDPLLKRFGSMYEQAKLRHDYGPTIKANSAKNKKLPHEIDDFVLESDKILGGRYHRVEEEDWIEQKNRRVKLADASSGQQESLPMLIVLLYRLKLGKEWRFIIEEPEAHLFPAAQRHQVNLLSILYSAGIDSFLTTHSPYILSALNVLVQADDVIRQKPSTEGQVRKLLGYGRPIAYDDLRVYALKDGHLTLEMNSENKLIDENVIDEVSTEFEHIFNELLTLQYPPDEVA